MTIATRPQPLLAAFVEPQVRASDIARRAGVSRTQVCRVLTGERAASPRVRAAASELLGLSEDLLFSALA